jgi:hypothetical protein
MNLQVSVSFERTVMQGQCVGFEDAHELGLFVFVFFAEVDFDVEGRLLHIFDANEAVAEIRVDL